ncbi:MAG: peptidylprolyl isomerase [candidate division Zixibacteria bacterium]|nr:peptidylprolyl isomerase [candidate division Zixibacteria bacterium]
MKRAVELLSFLLVCGLLFIGCGSSPDTVAVVNGEKLAVSLINNYFERLGTQFPSADAEFDAKLMAVDSLIDYHLLLAAAYERGLDLDPELVKIVISQRSRFLFDGLYRQEVMPKTEVSERELDEFLEKAANEFRLSHILVATEEEADSAYEEILSGADFGMIARALSLDQSSAVKGGDLGFVSWAAQLAPEFREVAFDLEIGAMSQPVRTGYGWHIIRHEDTRPSNLPKSEETRFFAREILRQRKTSAAELEFWNKMEKKADVQINGEATDLILEKLTMFYPDSVGGVPRPDNYFPDIDQLQPFEQEMVLATYTGGELTLADYLRKISNIQEFYRPHFADHDSLKKIIFQLELANIMEFEAEERNLEDTDEYRQIVRTFKEGMMVEKFSRTVLTRDIDTNDDEITEYYNSHLEDFMTEPQYHLREIEQDSLELLKDLLQEIEAGADFAELAAQYTIRPGYREKKGDLGMIASYEAPSLYHAARNLDVGGVSPVVKNGRGNYSIIQLIDATQAKIRPLEECARDVKSQILNLKRNNVTADWLEKRRAESDIQIFEDVIKKSIGRSKYEES